MKASIEKPKEKQFEPFKLIINVESVDDLRSLYLRFNMSGKEAERILPKSKNVLPPEAHSDVIKVWEVLEEECRKRNQFKECY